MAEDVEAFILENSLQQPTLIGHSMLVAALKNIYGILLISVVIVGVRRLLWF
jgi:hypothetical protein